MLRDFIASFRGDSLVLAVVVAIGAAPLASCGVKGPLKPAQPSVPAAGALPSETPATGIPQPPEKKP